VCIEAFRLLTMLPQARVAGVGAAGEGLPEYSQPVIWHVPEPLGRPRIGSYQHLMQRVDPKQLDALV
jgi:methionyl-tRNA synthetase